jgi:hypothetical protein
MGMFDDLIPQAPASQGGLFDDLIPGPPMPPQGAVPPRPGMSGNTVPGAPTAPAPPRGVLGAARDMVSAPLNAARNVIGAPNRMFQDYVADPVIEAITGGKEAAELAQANPGVTTSGGAPIGERVYGSFMNTPEALDRYLTNTYGAEGQGWYKMSDQFGKPTNRRVVRDKGGKERIFNPPGIDRGDVASMAGSVPDLVGGVAGAVASTPAYLLGPGVGIPASAVMSALGTQLVGEPIGRLFPENRAVEPDMLGQTVPRAGKEALGDSLVGTIMGLAGRGAVGIANKVRAPFAQTASQPENVAFREAADRLKQQGYDINPTPSEAGAGPGVARAEGILGKFPGAQGVIQEYRDQGNKAIARYQDDVIGGADPNVTGKQAVTEFETQRKNLLIDREEGLNRADDMITRNETDLLNRQGPLTSPEAAGQQLRGGAEAARKGFREEAGRLYDAARDAPGGRDAIVDMAAVKAQVQKIRSELPPEATKTEMAETGLLDAFGAPLQKEVQKGGASTEFTPEGLTRFLRGVDDISDSMTLDQARQMRTLVNDAIDDKTILPGVSERYLTGLAKSLTQAIDGSVDRVTDPTLKAALTSANTFYRDNVDKFSRKGVADLYRDPTQPGYVEDNKVVGRMVSGQGQPGVIRDTRETVGANTPEWAATRRQAMEDVLGSGRNETLYGRKVVNVDGLVGRLNQLDDEAVKEMFGVADAQQLRNLAADISNRTKYLDADALSQNGSQNILQQLRAAATADEQITRDYRDNVIAPFLRGEDGAAAKMKPEELVPYLYRKASPDEIKGVLGRLPPDMQVKVEKAAVADIIENAVAKGRGSMDELRRMLTGEGSPADGTALTALMGSTNDAAGRTQKARIEALLSPESRQALQDIATITIKRNNHDSVTAAIGGLAGGAAVTSAAANPATGLKVGLVAQGLARAITNPAVRTWLTNTKQTRLSPDAMAQMPNMGVALYDVMKGALGESEDIEAAGQWLRQGASQVDEKGRRALKPPDGAGSWEQYFGGKR